MIKIVISPELIDMHTSAVMKRLRESYDGNEILNCVKPLGLNSIEDFIKADVKTMRRWTKERPKDLQFDCFKKVYSNYFSNGAEKFVADEYNAYTFLRSLDVSVCPYCDDEYLDILNIDEAPRRNYEIDHFFQK